VSELFGTGPDSRWFDVAIFGYLEDDYTLAEGFAQAADHVLDTWKAGRRNDLLAVPVVYLYRHAIELALKQGIREAADRLRGDGNTDPALDRDAVDKRMAVKPFGHNLAALADELQVLLTRLKLATLPKDTIATLAALHTQDPTGETYRYALRREGREFVQARPEQTRVDIVVLGVKLREAFDVIAGGVLTELDVYADHQRDMRSFYDGP
jgi:hypothetical protein